MILQPGYNLEIPKMIASLFLITLTGIALFALFALMVWMYDRAPRDWHEGVLRLY
jgi:NitT/TauT family transport system permease protein